MASSSPVQIPASTPIVSDAPRGLPLPAESLVVLSREPDLTRTLRVLGRDHDIVSVAAESDLAGALLGRHTGVALLDAAAATSPIAVVTERLSSQFPDLVLIVAGGLDDQHALAKQITAGTVYRFLHKPVSEQRVKLFVEAAWRRHDADQAEASDPAAATGTHAQPRTTLPGRGLVAGGITLLALVALSGWLLTHKAHGPPSREAEPAAVTAPAPAARDDALESLLQRADRALAAGALVGPPGENAAELYRRALQHGGADPRAVSGIEQVIGKLLSAAEGQLAARHLEEAQKLTDQARALAPDHVRVAFVTAQIGKAREHAVLTQARQAASSGNYEQAIAVLDGAARDGHRSTLVAETRQELEQQKLVGRVAGFLAQAADRMQRGQILDPPQDNARYFIESARALAPNDAAVNQARRQLAEQVIGQARKALDAGQSQEAQRWIDAAPEAGVSRDDLAALTRDAAQARTAARAASLAQLAQLFNQRMTDGHLLDPPSDSAKFYLTQLLQADASHPSTVLAREALAARALQEAQAALRRQDSLGAQRWIAEAREAGADAAALGSLEHDLASAQEAARHATEFVAAGTLEQTHYSAPTFPVSARQRGVSGWVDMQFVVKADGSVSDVMITAAEPVGMFEQAAMDAVRKWRYKPVVRDGQPVDQHARLRMKFALEN